MFLQPPLLTASFSAAQNARRGGEHQKAGDGLGTDQLVVTASLRFQQRGRVFWVPG